MPPFKHLWIITRQSGICIFEARFGDEEGDVIDSDLISGLFSAILALGQEIARRDIQSMNFGEQVILFSTSPAFLFVLMSDDVDLDESRDTLNDIEREFRARYDDILDTFQAGDVSLFNDFGEFMEQYAFRPPIDGENLVFLGQQFDPAVFEEKFKDLSAHDLKSSMTEGLGKLKALLDKI